MDELKPIHSKRKSFYKKAQVSTEGGKKQLLSYDTLVAEIEDGKATVFGVYSKTTLRHIIEFLKQNDLKAVNREQIEADYIKK